jgi:CPA1 family monovalent cation:H+ antiporter
VLAVVATGLYFGRYGSGELTAAARLQQREIWDLIVFLLTGMSFLLIGLELRPILDSLVNRESGSLLVEASSVIGAVIVVRMAWMFVATALPGGQRLFGATRATRSWQETTVVGWAGMRGAVSLAAALALPQTFPQRELVIFLTFAVIVATLVGQGLTLPPLIRRLGLVSRDRQDSVLETEAQRRLTVIALSAIDDLTRTDRFPHDVVDRIRSGYESQLARIDRRLELISAGDDDGTEDGAGSLGGDGHGRAERELRMLVIAAERAELDRLLARRRITKRVPTGSAPRSTWTRPPWAPEPGDGVPPPRHSGRPTDMLQGVSEETPCRYRLLISALGSP